MPCSTHGNACAFPDWDPEICPVCHAPWSKITAPATRKVGRETRYLSGYNEPPLNHFWRHATDAARAEAHIAYLASRKRSAA